MLIWAGSYKLNTSYLCLRSDSYLEWTGVIILPWLWCRYKKSLSDSVMSCSFPSPFLPPPQTHTHLLLSIQWLLQLVKVINLICSKQREMTLVLPAVNQWTPGKCKLLLKLKERENHKTENSQALSTPTGFTSGHDWMTESDMTESDRMGCRDSLCSIVA